MGEWIIGIIRDDIGTTVGVHSLLSTREFRVWFSVGVEVGWDGGKIGVRLVPTARTNFSLKSCDPCVLGILPTSPLWHPVSLHGFSTQLLGCC